MTPRQRLLAVVALSTLAACGGGGGSGSGGSGGGSGGSGGGNAVNFIVTTGTLLSWSDGDCSGIDSVNGDFYSLSPATIASLNAQIASTGQAKVGIITFGNSIEMKITRPPPGMDVAPNRTVITIDNLLQVTRQKAVRPRNFQSNVVANLTKNSTIPGAVSMTIDKQSCSFGFLNVGLHGIDWVGFWHELGEFDPNTFWSLAGGNLVTFLWIGD